MPIVSAFLIRNSTRCLLVLAAILYASPLIFGIWASQLMAKAYGLTSAFLMAWPFFFDDWIKKSKQQAHAAVVKDGAEVLKVGHLKRLDRISSSWKPGHLRMMQLGLTLLAVSFLLEISAMISV